MKRQRKVKEFNVLIERDAEGYLVATVPALRGCHTQAKSLDKLMERVREAIEVCLEVEGGGSESLDFVGGTEGDRFQMTRHPRLRGKHVVAALERGGFVVVRVKGSHHYLRHQDGRVTVVPVHSS